ncbi:MAG TPA: hypothetical protein VM029_16815 [Opitutaceae bacterium]|nr:hypothetical protein [Opitutaceae bacterium]
MSLPIPPGAAALPSELADSATKSSMPMMRIMAAFLAVSGIHSAPVQPQVPLHSPPAKVLAVLPADVSEIATALAGRRLYYVSRPAAANKRQAVGGSSADELWMYDVPSGRAIQIGSGEMARLSVAASGTALTFMRPAVGPARAVWTIPLDATTGLPAAVPSRLNIAAPALATVSPDGVSIAYWTNSLNVAGIGGGDPRTILAGPFQRFPAPIWAADGNSVFVIIQRDPTLPNMALRVPVDGGDPVVLQTRAVTGSVVAPDGRYSLSSNRSTGGAALLPGVRLLDSAGSAVADLPLDWNPLSPPRWISSHEVMNSSSTRTGALRLLTMSDGMSRAVLSPDDDVREFSWSPDGRRFASIVGGDSSSIVICDAMGRETRRIPVVGSANGPLVWSPDGRSIALQDTARPGLLLVEVTNGKARALPTPSRGLVTEIRWMPNSRAFRYGITAPSDSADSKAARLLREVTIGGMDRLIARLPMDWIFVSGTTLLLWSDTASYIHSLVTGRSLEVSRVPTLRPASNGALIALRPPQAHGSNVHQSIQVLNAGGGTVANLTFPFQAGHILDGFQFARDGKRLIGAGRDPAGECCVVFEVPIAGGTPRVLVDITPHFLATQRVALSPDGRTLLYRAPGEFRTVVHSLDLAGVMRR